MILVPSGVRVWLAVGKTDMRRGMNGLSLQVQETLGRDPFAGWRAPEGHRDSVATLAQLDDAAAAGAKILRIGGGCRGRRRDWQSSQSSSGGVTNAIRDDAIKARVALQSATTGKAGSRKGRAHIRRSGS